MIFISMAATVDMVSSNPRSCGNTVASLVLVSHSSWVGSCGWSVVCFSCRFRGIVYTSVDDETKRDINDITASQSDTTSAKEFDGEKKRIAKESAAKATRAVTASMIQAGACQDK